MSYLKTFFLEFLCFNSMNLANQLSWNSIRRKWSLEDEKNQIMSALWNIESFHVLYYFDYNLITFAYKSFWDNIVCRNENK